MNELQQVLLGFAVVVIIGLYVLSRKRSSASDKKTTANRAETTQTKAASSKIQPNASDKTTSSNLKNATELNVSATTQQNEQNFGYNAQAYQASQALNDLGSAHIPLSKLTHDRLTRTETEEELDQTLRFNRNQTTLSFGEEFDLPEPLLDEVLSDPIPEPIYVRNTAENPAGNVESMDEFANDSISIIEPVVQEPSALNIASSNADNKDEDVVQHSIDPDVSLVGVNENGGKHHRLIVEDPGMNSAEYHYVAPDHEKPSFGVPAEEVGKSPGVPSGEKQAYEVFAILVMSTAQEFSMPLLNHALLGVGLVFSESGIYVKKDNMGNEIIKVANLLEPGSFPKADLENHATPGVVMILELPTTVKAPAAMHDMIMMARKVSQRLQGRLYNMERHLLKESDLQVMRDIAVSYESKPIKNC